MNRSVFVSRIKAVMFPTFMPFSVKQSDTIQVAVAFNFILFYYYPESAGFYFIRARG